MVIILEKERNGNVWRPLPSQWPVPWGGTQGKSGECEAWVGGTKQTTVPQREALFWARRGYKKSAARWMNGWLTDCVDGSWVAGWKSGWAACPQRRHVKEPGQVWGMWGMIWKQSWLLSPMERPCPGLQGTRSQPLRMERWMNWWLACLLVSVNNMHSLWTL